MENATSGKEPKKPIGGSPSDHLANERTYLAWVRTSIGIMAFGFVVVKFNLFIKQIAIVLQKQIAIDGHGYSAVLGIFLVGFGALVGLLAFLRYKLTEKQLTDATYKPSALLSTMLAVSIVVVGILLVVYLVHSVQ
jgi:putative membrane protein